ncbi:Pycsar system effector family protein [Streptomyces sp. NPDC051546]|uniref:Pycsar system effector family protein n=1 Tax=Streptomyces sp. NPDC051546 TaxID=3365655 RepID=UPI0037B04F55
MTPAADSRNEAAFHLLADIRVEIARADSKAALLVGALGMTAGLLSTQLAGRHWRPGSLSGPGQILWWSGVGGLALALAALLLAVLPRALTAPWRPGRPLSYFGDVRSAHRQGRLEEALTETSRDPASALQLSLTATSEIAVQKHLWIRTGLIAFCTGVFLLPAALLIG